MFNFGALLFEKLMRWRSNEQIIKCKMQHTNLMRYIRFLKVNMRNNALM